MAQGTLWIAQWAVRNGLSANAGLRVAQDMGLGVRRETWLSMYGQVRNRYAVRAATLGALMSAIPSGPDVTPIPTKQAEGFVQYVDIWLRDKGSGEPRVREQSLRTDTLLSREQAVDILVSRYRGAVDRSKVSPGLWGTTPDEVVIGGIYTGTIQFVPSLET